MYTDSFTDYLKNDKKASANTVEAYRRDIDGFRKYMEERGSSDLAVAVSTDITGYMLKLRTEGKSASTINRKMASLRAFYSFLAEGVMSEATLRQSLPYPGRKPESLNTSASRRLKDCWRCPMKLQQASETEPPLK